MDKPSISSSTLCDNPTTPLSFVQEMQCLDKIVPQPFIAPQIPSGRWTVHCPQSLSPLQKWGAQRSTVWLQADATLIGDIAPCPLPVHTARKKKSGVIAVLRRRHACASGHFAHQKQTGCRFNIDSQVIPRAIREGVVWEYKGLCWKHMPPWSRDSLAMRKRNNTCR